MMSNDQQRLSSLLNCNDTAEMVLKQCLKYESEQSASSSEALGTFKSDIDSLLDELSKSVSDQSKETKSDRETIDDLMNLIVDGMGRIDPAKIIDAATKAKNCTSRSIPIANRRQLDLYQKGTEKLREQRTKELQRTSSSKRINISSCHANNTQIALYEKGVAKVRKERAQTLEEKRRVTQSGSLRVTPTSNARCERLYNLSKGNQLRGKIRRHEVLMKSEYYQTLLTKSSLKSACRPKSKRANPRRDTISPLSLNKIDRQAMQKSTGDQSVVTKDSFSPRRATTRGKTIPVETTVRSISSMEGSTKISKRATGWKEVPSPRMTKPCHVKEENTDSKQARLQKISSIMEYAASRAESKRSEIDTMDTILLQQSLRTAMDTILLQQSLRTVEEEIDEDNSRDDPFPRNEGHFWTHRDPVRNKINEIETLSGISTIKEEVATYDSTRITKDLPIMKMNFDGNIQNCSNLESRWDNTYFLGREHDSVRTQVENTPPLQPLMVLADKGTFSPCEKDVRIHEESDQIEVVWK